MISYVKGILAEKAKDRIVVESGMMGIGIFVPMSVLEVLPPLGEEVKIYTHLQVREDDMSLYGFLSRSDLEMFRQLLGVNGIGPKGALGILSALRPEDLRLAVMTGDAKAISRAPGVGAKTAQRIILDLKDKVQAEDLAMIEAEKKRQEAEEQARLLKEQQEAEEREKEEAEKQVDQTEQTEQA